MADVKKIIKGVVDLPSHLKEAVEAAHAPKIFYSTAGRLADKISEANPKMSDYEVMKRAMNQSTQKLDWERVDKPALEKTYGDLSGSTFTDSKVKRMRNTPAVVEERKRTANEFLDQPTEPWVPPKPELQAFDRSSIKDALEGFPDVPQSVFPRDIPPRASTKHVDEMYTDPENRALIKKQIMRGLPLGGESFYASLYPVKQAVLEAGMPASKFDSWVHSMAPASARNSIMNEMAVGQFLRNLHSQGISLTPENVTREMAAFKKQFGIGLPLFDGHRLGVANVLENNLNLRDLSQANIPTNYKIPTYGAQKTGDFAHSATLDVHEAAGQSQGSRSHPYFTEAGGFGNTEYNAGEQGFLGIAKELGVPGGMAQAGRWFGGGELTGLKSPRGDALDLLEKQFAFSLLHQGRQPNPANIRSEVLKQIETGEGTLLPWYRKEGMPDVRTTGLQRKDGGQVEHMQAGGVKKAFGALTQLEKEANLARYLEQSVVKDRLYHGTGKDITSFRPNLESGATFLTPTPAFANKFAMDDLLYDSNSAYRGAPSGANVMPVYAQVKNPWDYENPKHIEAVAKILDPQDRKAFRKQAPTGNWLAIEDHYPSIQHAGFDAAHVMEGGVKNLGVFNQKAIKSALGNRGTYDVTDPDITKADGGKVEHMQAGGVKKLIADIANKGGVYTARRLERAADEIPNLEKLYEEQAILRAFSGDNAQAVMTMKPSDFERYAAPLGSSLSDRSLQKIAHITNVHNKGGFSDVPYLNINKKEQGTMGLPYIAGHEGRHRSRVMDTAGEQAGLVQLVPRAELREPFPRRSQEEYIEALHKEMQLTGNRVKPEAYYLDPIDEKTYQRKTIDLPDFYAEGGAVHMNKGGDALKYLAALLNKSQGAHGAQRLERAADLIPNLERLYTQQALKDAFTQKNALTIMPPSDFGKLAERLRISENGGKQSSPASRLKDMSLDEYVAQLGNVTKQGGFDSTPQLWVGRFDDYIPHIAGHEGRHRSLALDSLGQPNNLVQVLQAKTGFSLPSGKDKMPAKLGEKYIQKMNDFVGEQRLVTPEGGSLLPKDLSDPQYSWLKKEGIYDDNVRALPELFNEGGAVHSQAEDGDIMRQLFDHALDNGDIHEMTHAMLVKQHEAEHG